MGKFVDRRLEAIYYDLKLYFEILDDQNKWNLRIEDGYLNMNKATWDEFTEVLEDYCIDNDLNIMSRRENVDGDSRTFEIERFDHSTLLQKTVR